MKVIILDSTLREGKQSFYFDHIDKIQEKYIKLASELGVNDFEYRNPLHSKKDQLYYSKLLLKFPKLNFHTHVFLSESNIKKITKTGLDIKNISTFISPPFTSTTFDNLDKLLKIENKKFRVCIEKTPSININELKEAINYLISKKNIERISFSDTLGVFDPEKINKFVKFLGQFDFKEKSIEFHLHNDFNLASANACELLQKLKKIKSLYLSASMFGIGDRNGILSFGDLISNLTRLNIKHDYKIKNYGKLVKLFENEKIIFNRDPLNSTSYYHFASSHIIRGFQNQKYYSIQPQKIGLDEQYVFSKLTDSYIFDYINEELADNKLKKISKNIKQYVLKQMQKLNRKSIFLDELLSILKK